MAALLEYRLEGQGVPAAPRQARSRMRPPRLSHPRPVPGSPAAWRATGSGSARNAPNARSPRSRHRRVGRRFCSLDRRSASGCGTVLLWRFGAVGFGRDPSSGPLTDRKPWESRHGLGINRRPDARNPTWRCPVNAGLMRLASWVSAILCRRGESLKRDPEGGTGFRGVQRIAGPKGKRLGPIRECGIAVRARA